VVGPEVLVGLAEVVGAEAVVDFDQVDQLKMGLEMFVQLSLLIRLGSELAEHGQRKQRQLMWW